MKDQNSNLNSKPVSSQSTAAIGLITANVLSMFGMLHHPVAKGNSHTDYIQSLISISTMNQLVHGTLIATTLITWLCLFEFSSHKIKQTSVRNGILLYSLGTLAMLGAALTNGFVIIRLAESLIQSSNGIQSAGPMLFQLTWAINQTLTGFGVIAMCAGITCWSLHLLSGAKYARILAVTALVMVAVQIGMIWIDLGHFGVGQMLVFVVWQALWCVGVALLMLRKQEISI